jgi:nitrite reductase/ring-hydroxylating ferredoxin subunit
MAMADPFVLCLVAELSDPDARECRVGDTVWPLRVIVVRRQGAIYAYRNRCPHAGHALNLRPNEFLDVARRQLMCRSHGALFEIESGRCVAGPCTGAWLEPISVIIEAGEVRLAPGIRVTDDLPSSAC